MRRFLLIAAAMMMVASVNAQVLSKQNVQKPQTATSFKHYQAVPAKDAGEIVLATRHANNKVLKLTESLKANTVPASKFKSVSAPAKAAMVAEKYEATGNHVKEGAMSWEMISGTAELEDGTAITLLRNVIPTPFEFDVDVEYTLADNTITIEPQLVAASEEDQMYVFLESGTSSTGAITLTLNNDGSIAGSYSILYGAYDSDDYANANYLGYYGNFLKGIKYNLEGVVAAPEVSFEPNSLVLFAGLGLNGYSYNNNLAMTSAYAPLNFYNLTTDPATGWEWSITQNDLLAENEEEAETVITGTDKDFTVNTLGYTIYTNPQLVGYNKTVSSDPFLWAQGKIKGDNAYDEVDIYTYAYEDFFMLNNETPAILTRQDPDGDLTFYTNWGTPNWTTELSSPYSMSKIYIYHDKPASPLYMTGVTVPLVASEFEDDFNLQISLYKCTREANGDVTMGDLIAQGEATLDNVNADFDRGLTAVEFRELFTEDETGMSQTLDYLFIDSEFMIVIEGWDNGTFKGVIGCQDTPMDNAITSTWFEDSSEPGSMYSYTSWKTSLFVGLLGVDMGWLHTEDDTNVTLPVEGGEATLHISPKYYSNSEEEGITTALFLDENIDGNDIPEWLELSYTNPVETGEFDEDGEPIIDTDFDLTVTAEPLPEGMESREATIVLMQWGAQLTLNITQKNEVVEPQVLDVTIDHERQIGLGYNVTIGEVDFTEAKAFLGVEELTTDMLRIENPDGTLISDYAPYDGWFNGDGVAEMWGANTKVCVKFFQAIPDGQFQICDMNGADVDGATYTVRWQLVNGEKTVRYAINVKFYEPVVEIPTDIVDLGVATSVTYDKAEGSYVEKVVSLTDEQVSTICSALGISNLGEATAFGYNPTTKEVVKNYMPFDGWRNADGDFTNWSGTSAVPACVKYSDGVNYYCYNIGGCDPQTIKCYWLLAKGVKGVLVEIDFIYVDKVGINDLATDKADAVIYNLRGQRVEAPVKGLYIVNGKKVVK